MLVEGDVGWFKKVMGADFTTANLGGAISGTQINGSTIGEIFFAMTPAASGGGVGKQTQAIAFRNASLTDDAIGVSFWGANFAIQIPSLNTLSAQSTSVLDTSAYFIRFVGFDNSGNPISIDLQLNGQTLATTSSSMLILARWILMSTLTGLPTSGNGDITVSSGSTVLGIMANLDGFSSFTTEGWIGVAGTQNDVVTIATAAADPASITFFQPVNLSTSLSASGGGNIVNCGSHSGTPNYQTVWCRLLIAEMVNGSSDCQFIPRAKVNRS